MDRFHVVLVMASVISHWFVCSERRSATFQWSAARTRRVAIHCSEDMPSYSLQLLGDKNTVVTIISQQWSQENQMRRHDPRQGCPCLSPTSTKSRPSGMSRNSRQVLPETQEGVLIWSAGGKYLACDCIGMIKRNLCTATLAVCTTLQMGTCTIPSNMWVKRSISSLLQVVSAWFSGCSSLRGMSPNCSSVVEKYRSLHLSDMLIYSSTMLCDSYSSYSASELMFIGTALLYIISEKEVFYLPSPLGRIGEFLQNSITLFPSAQELLH